jgi:SAM-dependent MidA family methyltransferase
MHAVCRQLEKQIARQGVIPFSQFMETALYCPECGYYERTEGALGRRGDFYTAVSVGPLFGELLAQCFGAWLAALFQQSPGSALQLVEAGAHDGQLALDLLSALRQQRPALAARAEYLIVEPSVRRRAWQQAKLKEFAGCVRWVSGWDAVPLGGVRGVIFCNELLDALPVHRLAWDARAGAWVELGVTLRAGEFAWERMPLSVTAPSLPAELLAVLPDGFATEVCPAAVSWWRAAAGALGEGKLVMCDYGLEALDFFRPERADGTVRAYHAHRLVADLLARPGEQDLTAHVNFTGLIRAGEDAGLKTESLLTQAKFLTDIARQAWAEPPGGAPVPAGRPGAAAWTPARTRQFQTLTHPEHLGRAFRVLTQAR